MFDMSAASQATENYHVEGTERDSLLPSTLCKCSQHVKMMDFSCSWPGKGQLAKGNYPCLVYFQVLSNRACCFSGCLILQQSHNLRLTPSWQRLPNLPWDLEKNRHPNSNQRGKGLLKITSRAHRHICHTLGSTKKCQKELGWVGTKLCVSSGCAAREQLTVQPPRLKSSTKKIRTLVGTSSCNIECFGVLKAFQKADKMGQKKEMEYGNRLSVLWNYKIRKKKGACSEAGHMFSIEACIKLLHKMQVLKILKVNKMLHLRYQ